MVNILLSAISFNNWW